MKEIVENLSFEEKCKLYLQYFNRMNTLKNWFHLEPTEKVVKNSNGWSKPDKVYGYYSRFNLWKDLRIQPFERFISSTEIINEYDKFGIPD